ncbi:MAG: hypothetical protein Q9208_000660 [Pyrenodesmia sp. 3 TL-2023]
MRREFTGYIQAFIIYFFVRASANWETVPNAKCFSKDVLVITNQINAGKAPLHYSERKLPRGTKSCVALACACDIITALIPQFLLWNIQMKARTKRQLNFIFALGLITALLSIGRAATTTKATLTEDTSWRMVPSYYFTSFECQLGIIIACGPALRQFWAYRSRTHTSLPTKHRQAPNEDFKKMRYRINLRDIFWYREAHMVGDRVLEAAPIFQRKSPPPDASSSDPKSSTKVSNSALDIGEKKTKNVFHFGHNHETARRLPSGDSKSSPSDVSQKERSNESSELGDLPSKKPRPSSRWGLFSSKPGNKTVSSPRETFLLSDSGAGTNATLSTRGDEFHSSTLDSEFNDELYNTGLPKPPHGSQMV